MPRGTNQSPARSPEPSAAGIWYPLIAGPIVVIHLFGVVLPDGKLTDLWLPLVLVEAYGAALWMLGALVFRGRSRGGVFSTVVTVLTLFYAQFDYRAHAHFGNGTLWLWLLITLGLATLGAFAWKWHRLLNVFSIILALFVSGSLVLNHARSSKTTAEKALSIPTLAPQATRPDIYFIVFDSYGRSDQLKRVIGVDDSPFIGALQKRGFYVAPLCHSNYVQTELSIASTLNMEPIQQLLPNSGPKTTDRSALYSKTDDCAVANMLRSVGYDVDYVASGFPVYEFTDVHQRLGLTQKNPLLAAILDRTPYLGVKALIGSNLDERRSLLSLAFSDLSHLTTETTTKPKFVFVHILAPHPSFVFQADGSKPTIYHGNDLFDGSDYMDRGGSTADFKTGYAGQTLWIDSQILPIIDVLLTKSGTPPVILIEGDHGSRMGMNMNSLAGTDLREAASNLMAFYVPSNVAKELYPAITPVNSFRVVLSGLFKANLKQLSDQSWYSPYNRPFDFTDITDRLRVGDKATTDELKQ